MAFGDCMHKKKNFMCIPSLSLLISPSFFSYFSFPSSFISLSPLSNRYYFPLHLTNFSLNDEGAMLQICNHLFLNELIITNEDMKYLKSQINTCYNTRVLCDNSHIVTNHQLFYCCPFFPGSQYTYQISGTEQDNANFPIFTAVTFFNFYYLNLFFGKYI